MAEPAKIEASCQLKAEVYNKHDNTHYCRENWNEVVSDLRRHVGPRRGVIWIDRSKRDLHINYSSHRDNANYRGQHYKEPGDWVRNIVRLRDVQRRRSVERLVRRRFQDTKPPLSSQVCVPPQAV